MTPDLLSTRETAERLGIKPNTLVYWRGRGDGPRWYRLGTKDIRYRWSDVEDWLESRANAARG